MISVGMTVVRAVLNKILWSKGRGEIKLFVVRAIPVFLWRINHDKPYVIDEGMAHRTSRHRRLLRTQNWAPIYCTVLLSRLLFPPVLLFWGQHHRDELCCCWELGRKELSSVFLKCLKKMKLKISPHAIFSWDYVWAHKICSSVLFLLIRSFIYLFAYLFIFIYLFILGFFFDASICLDSVKW
jgi:hypothetical protein